MARMGGLTAAQNRRKKATREMRRKGGRSNTTQDELDEMEQEIEAAERDERQIRLADNERVVAELNSDVDRHEAAASEVLFNPDDHKGIALHYMRFAWRARQVEQHSAFVAVIMSVIMMASILVGVNTYELDSDGKPLLSSRTVAGLEVLDTIILVIFWAELALKAVGCGLQPWRFFFVAWYALQGQARLPVPHCLPPMLML